MRPVLTSFHIAFRSLSTFFSISSIVVVKAMAEPAPWQDFHGDWNVTKSERMEDFLGEVGVPWPIRKIAANVSSTMKMKVDGDKIKIQMVSTFHTQPENEFHVNGGETLADFGKNKFKATMKYEDGKLICHLDGQGKAKSQTVTRQIVNGEMIQVLVVFIYLKLN